MARKDLGKNVCLASSVSRSTWEWIWTKIGRIKTKKKKRGDTDKGLVRICNVSLEAPSQSSIAGVPNHWLAIYERHAGEGYSEIGTAGDDTELGTFAFCPRPLSE